MATSYFRLPFNLGSNDNGRAQYDQKDLDFLPHLMSSTSLAQDPPPSGVYSVTDNQGVRGPVPSLCSVCKTLPRYSKNGRGYPTCGLACAAKLHTGSTSNLRNRNSMMSFTSNATNTSNKPLCVICKARGICRDYVTCGLTCAERLCIEGGSPSMCNYCHRSPRLSGKMQCGTACADKAKVSCLLCKCRPRNGDHVFCGMTCQRLSLKLTPIILYVPKEHSAFKSVEDRFRSGWKSSARPIPTIKGIFRVIDDGSFEVPYKAYLGKVGNEVYRFHGTTRQCNLGVSTTRLCTSQTCPTCNILKSSFKVSKSKATGAFGNAIYTSSASNKAFIQYCGAGGVLVLAKVALGKPKIVTKFEEYKSCPPGFNSVVFERQGGSLNETVVYSDDAIRPTFIIVF